MKAVVLLACLALPVWADDVPKQFCLEPLERMTLARKLATLEGENESLKKSATEQMPPWLPVLIGIAAFGVGLAAGYGVAQVVKK